MALDPFINPVGTVYRVFYGSTGPRNNFFEPGSGGDFARVTFDVDGDDSWSVTVYNGKFLFNWPGESSSGSFFSGTGNDPTVTIALTGAAIAAWVEVKYRYYTGPNQNTTDYTSQQKILSGETAASVTLPADVKVEGYRIRFWANP